PRLPSQGWPIHFEKSWACNHAKSSAKRTNWHGTCSNWSDIWGGALRSNDGISLPVQCLRAGPPRTGALVFRPDPAKPVAFCWAVAIASRGTLPMAEMSSTVRRTVLRRLGLLVLLLAAGCMPPAAGNDAGPGHRSQRLALTPEQELALGQQAYQEIL